MIEDEPICAPAGRLVLAAGYRVGLASEGRAGIAEARATARRWS